MPDFDLIVIGAGPGGYVAAIRAAQLGLKVACVEKRKTLGGTCLNIGCIPSKALLHGSELYGELAGGHMEKFGIRASSVKMDLKALMREKEKTIKELTSGIDMLFKKNKVTRIQGTAFFETPSTLNIQKEDGAEQKLSANNILIATGSEPAALSNIEIDGKTVITSTEALSLSSTPKHLVVIGGGVIGLELGSVWMRLGAKITVLEYTDTLCPGMDGEIVRDFTKILKSQGMDINTGCKVTGVDIKSNKAKVSYEVMGATGKDAKSQITNVDKVLMAVGRKPHTQDLNLDKIGVEMTKGVIRTRDQGATNIKGIWAIGDVTPGPMLAHKAEDEAIACVEAIAGMTSHINYDTIPAVVYTQPEVASVGKTEEALKKDGTAYRIGKFPFAANSRAKTNRDFPGFVKILACKSTDRILGVHIIGPYAGTLIAEAVVAMEMGASAEDLALTCHAHPTHAEAVKEAALAVHNRAIHI